MIYCGCRYNAIHTNTSADATTSTGGDVCPFCGSYTNNNVVYVSTNRKPVESRVKSQFHTHNPDYHHKPHFKEETPKISIVVRISNLCRKVFGRDNIGARNYKKI